MKEDIKNVQVICSIILVMELLFGIYSEMRLEEVRSSVNDMHREVVLVMTDLQYIVDLRKTKEEKKWLDEYEKGIDQFRFVDAGMSTNRRREGTGRSGKRNKRTIKE